MFTNYTYEPKKKNIQYVRTNFWFVYKVVSFNSFPQLLYFVDISPHFKRGEEQDAHQFYVPSLIEKCKLACHCSTLLIIN